MTMECLTNLDQALNALHQDYDLNLEFFSKDAVFVCIRCAHIQEDGTPVYQAFSNGAGSSRIDRSPLISNRRVAMALEQILPSFLTGIHRAADRRLVKQSARGIANRR